MEAMTLLRAGHLSEARAALLIEVRNRPEDSGLRSKLFALDCILGNWERALNHIETMASVSVDWQTASKLNQGLIGAELHRMDVFHGKRKPIFLGTPPEWAAWLVEAFSLEASGHEGSARELRNQSWDESPALAAVIDGQSHAWLADADRRLGPVLEVVMEGIYHWVPYSLLIGIRSEAPKTLANLVWLPVTLSFVNGTDIPAHIPVRYPGTIGETDSELLLAKKTIWREGAGGAVGLGQKMYSTDQGDLALLECRSVEIANSPQKERDAE